MMKTTIPTPSKRITEISRTGNLAPICNIPAAVITIEQACGSIGEVIAAIGSVGHGKHFDSRLGWLPAWKVKVGEYEQEFVIVDINPKHGFVDVRHRHDRKWERERPMIRYSRAVQCRLADIPPETVNGYILTDHQGNKTFIERNDT